MGKSTTKRAHLDPSSKMATLSKKERKEIIAKSVKAKKPAKKETAKK